MALPHPEVSEVGLDQVPQWLGPFAPAVATMALVPFRGSLSPADAVLVLVLVLLALARYAPRGATLFGTVVAVLSFDFFYLPPYGNLVVDARADIAALVLLAVVGCASASLVPQRRPGLTASSR